MIGHYKNPPFPPNDLINIKHSEIEWIRMQKVIWNVKYKIQDNVLTNQI